VFLPRPCRQANDYIKEVFYRKKVQRRRISVNTIYEEIDFAGVPYYTFEFPNLHLIFFLSIQSMVG